MPTWRFREMLTFIWHISHYFTYLPALWMGHLCFTSCWLRGALQVCEGHRARRLCIYLLRSWGHQITLSQQFPSVTRTNYDEAEAMSAFRQEKKKRLLFCTSRTPQPIIPFSSALALKLTSFKKHFKSTQPNSKFNVQTQTIAIAQWAELSALSDRTVPKNLTKLLCL